MANLYYPLWKQELLKLNANSALNSAEGATGVYAALVDTGVYIYSAAHQFYSQLTGVVGTDQEILAKTQALGVFDGNDVTFGAVSGASIEAIVLYRKNAGASTTWQLIAYMDTGVSGLPVTPNSGSIVITWAAPGILAL